MSELANTEATKRHRSSSPSGENKIGGTEAPPAKKQATETEISADIAPLSAPSTSEPKPESTPKVESEEAAVNATTALPAEKPDRNEGKKYRRASGKEGEGKRGRDRQPWGPKSGTREIVSTDGAKAEGSGEDGVKRLPKKRVALLIG